MNSLYVPEHTPSPLSESLYSGVGSLSIASAALIMPESQSIPVFDEIQNPTLHQINQYHINKSLADTLISKSNYNKFSSQNIPRILLSENSESKFSIYTSRILEYNANSYKVSQQQVASASSLLSSNQLTGLGFGAFGDDQYMLPITPDMLPNMALPVIAFIEQVQPHIVIGCDRGGRLFSVAVHSTWNATKKGMPFPTLDGKIHFARISKSEDEAVLQQKIDDIVASAKKFGEYRGIVLEDDEQLRVLFIDDWVVGGGTKNLAERLMFKYNASTFFAVMTGRNADVSGDPEFSSNVSWHDDPSEIGVNYLSTIRSNPTNGKVEESLEAVAVNSLAAKRNRKKIHETARDLALKLI